MLVRRTNAPVKPTCLIPCAGIITAGIRTNLYPQLSRADFPAIHCFSQLFHLYKMGAKCSCFQGATDRKPELDRVLSRNTTPASTPMEPLEYPEEPVALSQLHPRVRDIFEQLKTKAQITEISLAGKELGNQGALHLGIMIEHTPELKQLDLSNCGILWEGMANVGLSLRRLRQLQVLNISGNDLGFKGAQYLASALTFLRDLRTLSLNDTNLGPKGVKLIAHRLRDTSELEELLLSKNSLSDEGGEELSKFIGKCVNLRMLDLSNNLLRDCFQSLQKSLRRLQQLVVLKLDCNFMGDFGAETLGPTLGKLKSLGHLDLSFNEITAQGIKALQPAIGEMKGVRELFLEGNYLGTEGARYLAAAVGGMDHLEVLGLVNCGVGEGRTEIRLAAPRVDILL